MTQISITTTVERQDIPPAPDLPPVWWIPHDKYRFDYDDRLRRHSRGWAFNPRGDGPARYSARSTGSSKPTVYRQRPEHSIRLSNAHVGLLIDLNPELTEGMVRGLLDVGLAWCNAQWGVFHVPIIMGGASVTGSVGYSVNQLLIDAGQLVRSVMTRRQSFMATRARFQALAQQNVLWINTLLTSQPVPSAQYMIDNFLCYTANGTRPNGLVNYFLRPGKDGQDHRVKMFMVTVQRIYAPLDEVHKLPPGFVPDALWMPEPQS